MTLAFGLAAQQLTAALDLVALPVAFELLCCLASMVSA